MVMDTVHRVNDLQRGFRKTVARAVASALLLVTPALADSGPSCAACVSDSDAVATCSGCPPEVLAVLEGKRLLTRESAELENDCVAFLPIHPMLLDENQHLLSKPLDQAEVINAGSFGYRKLEALPGCAARAMVLPSHVLFARPLRIEESQQDDGTAKPIVYVDAKHPSCLSAPSPDLSLAQRIVHRLSPACEISTAVQATRNLGGVIIEIAGGTYLEPRRMDLGDGQILTPRRSELVTISGWIDISAGTGDRREWVKASQDETGVTWVVDWSHHEAAGGSRAVSLPLELDGLELEMARHFSRNSMAPDVKELVFADYDATGAGNPPIFLFANPDHPASCSDSGVNVKSRRLECENAGKLVPCEICREKGIPIGRRVPRDGSCVAPAGSCAPATTWQTSKQAGLVVCQRALGPQVRSCVLLKLPPGTSPTSHRIRSANTDNGFRLFNNQSTDNSGIVLRNLRLENLQVSASGPPQAGARSGNVIRLDAVELEDSQIQFLGPSRMILENSYGEKGNILVSGSGGSLADVVIRNNFLNRYYGKPISWGDGPRDPIGRMPRRVHDLPPLCSGADCAKGGSRSLFSGGEDFFLWEGWNKILFNLLRNGAAVNAFGPMANTVIFGNVFEQGGVQEGIVDLPVSSEHVLIYQNWSRNGLGVGILIGGAVHDVVVADNQLIRTPGTLALGAGTDRSREVCEKNPSRPCEGTPWSIQIHPDPARCRDLTIENNLSAYSSWGGIALSACDGMTVQNNTVVDSSRHSKFLFQGAYAGSPARILDNVASHSAQRRVPGIDLMAARGTFPVGLAKGNYFQGCSSGGSGCPKVDGATWITTDPGWSRHPRYRDPSSGDFHLIDGWERAASCARGAGVRYRRPGFNYLDELCPFDTHGSPESSGGTTPVRR